MALPTRIEERLDQFNRLQNIENAVKQKLLQIIKSQLTGTYSKSISNMDKIYIFGALFIFVVIIFISYIITPVFSPTSINIFSVAFIPFLLLAYLIYLLLLLFTFVLIYRYIKIWLINFSWGILVSTMSYICIRHLFFGFFHQLLILNSLLIALYSECIFWISFFSLVIIYIALITRRTAHYPLSVIIDNLILILYEAEKCTSNSIDLQYTQNQLLRLERVAKSFEYYLPRQMPSGDPVTRLRLNKIGLEVAVAIREYKALIAMPTEDDAYKQFTEKIASTLINVLNGNWEALDKITLEDALKKEGLTLPPKQSYISSILKTAILAFLPLATFLILLHFFRDIIYIDIIWTFWIAFTILIGLKLSPELGSVISTLNQFLPSFPFFPKNN